MTASAADARTQPASRWFLPAFILLCLLSFAALIVGAFDPTIRFSSGQRCDSGDLVNYYYATLAGVEGLNPYDRPAIAARFDAYTHFVYPIYTLPLFLPFAVLDFQTARLAYLIAQSAALVGMVLILRRLLPVDWRLLSVMLPLGFGNAMVRDLCHANTVIFESFVLWFAIAALWRGRNGFSAAMLLVAALPKLLWLALLPLLAHRAVAAFRVLAIAVFVSAAGLSLWLLISPETFWHWLGNVRVTTSFRLNVFTMLRAVDEGLGGAVGGARLERWESWAYFGWLALVGGTFALVCRRGIGLRSLSGFAVLSLMAVWPGHGVYSWVPLVPIAAALIFFLAASGRRIAALALAALCLAPWQAVLLIDPGVPWFWGPLMAALMFWFAAASILLRQPQAFERWLARTAPALILPHSAPILRP